MSSTFLVVLFTFSETVAFSFNINSQSGGRTEERREERARSVTAQKETKEVARRGLESLVVGGDFQPDRDRQLHLDIEQEKLAEV